MIINRKWNKVSNGSHGRKLPVIKCNLECPGRNNLERKTGKKLLPTFSNLVNCSPCLRRQHWEDWNSIHLFHLEKKNHFYFL